MKLFKKKVTPSEFYVNCVKATHDLAMKQGIIKGGAKKIPELQPYGVQLLHSDLSSDSVVSQYPDNARLIQALSDRCLMYGIILADTWHHDFSHLQEMADEIDYNGPNGYIQDLIEEELGFTPQRFSQWLGAVFTTCINEYGSISNDGKDYLLKIPLACYQVGISMMLSHYGF